MYEIVFTVRSLTDAQRGQAACRRQGITAAVVRTPARLSEGGCGYALRVRSEDGPQTAVILHQARIPYGREAVL